MDRWRKTPKKKWNLDRVISKTFRHNYTPSVIKFNFMCERKDFGEFYECNETHNCKNVTLTLLFRNIKWSYRLAYTMHKINLNNGKCCNDGVYYNILVILGTIKYFFYLRVSYLAACWVVMTPMTAYMNTVSTMSCHGQQEFHWTIYLHHAQKLWDWQKTNQISVFLLNMATVIRSNLNIVIKFVFICHETKTPL